MDTKAAIQEILKQNKQLLEENKVLLDIIKAVAPEKIIDYQRFLSRQKKAIERRDSSLVR